MNNQMLDKLKGMLIQNNLDPVALINKLNKVSQSIFCQGECQRNRIRMQLQWEYEAAKQNLRSAPSQEHEAEKNLYVFDKSYQEYIAMIFNRNTVTASAFKKDSLALHTTYTTDLNVLIQQYTTEVRLAGRIEELFMTKMEDYVLLKQKLDSTEKNANTLGRKIAYEDNDASRILIIKKMILFIYYGLFVMYLIFGSFFGKQQYTNKAMWWLIYCYLLAPLITYDTSKQLFSVASWTAYMWQDTAPKNVYINI